MSVNWYPGHMAKAKRKVQEAIKKVELVVELRDARVPYSSANPALADIVGNKPRVIVLNKADLADSDATLRWQDYFTKQGINSIAFVSTRPRSINKLISSIEQEAIKYVRKSRITKKPLRAARCMVLGIPNVGKSSFINAVRRKGTARTGAKPGLTRGQQVINITANLQLLDTPGILWPRFDEQEVGIKLAATGAISTAGFPLEKVVEYIFGFLNDNDSLSFTGIKGNQLSTFLNEFALQRGYLRKGGELDLQRAMQTFWQEFAAGKYGRFSLELP